jgi:hypothetical protein
MKFIIETGLIFISLYAIAAIGWIVNIVKLIGSIPDPVTVLTLLRIVGIFAAPLGAVLGLFF